MPSTDFTLHIRPKDEIKLRIRESRIDSHPTPYYYLKLEVNGFNLQEGATGYTEVTIFVERIEDLEGMAYDILDQTRKIREKNGVLFTAHTTKEEREEHELREQKVNERYTAYWKAQAEKTERATEKILGDESIISDYRREKGRTVDPCPGWDGIK